MKKLALFFIAVSTFFAQYSAQDYELVKTTFLREFDRNIINEYLQSGDEQKVKAALLSIAQSEDTTFVPSVINLDFEKYGDLISFTLGEIGSCKASSNYLIEKLQQKDANFSSALYEAIGKIGNVEDLLDCINIYKENYNDGFPLAVFNFHTQGIVDTNLTDVNIILKNLNSSYNNEKLFRSLFTIYRIAPDKADLKDLEIILRGCFGPTIKTYALGILRKTQSFPYSFDLVKKLIFSEDWNIRCEAARTLCYFEYETAEQLNLYLNLLFDDNPNVGRTCAQSLINLDIESVDLEDKYLSAIDMLFKSDLTPNVKGEILLSLQFYYEKDTLQLIEAHLNDVDDIYIWQLLGNYKYDPYYAFEEFKDDYESADDYEKFLINSSISNLYDSLNTNDTFANFIVGQYLSGTPLSITLFNYVVDSSFVALHSDRLKNNINHLVDSKISNPDYNGAIVSLFNITDYIDSNFTKDIIDKVANSNNFDLQYDLRNEIGLSEKTTKHRNNLFDKLFENSFKYSKAIVKTDKGDFTILFTPEVAPISVGNFIYLAENDFYDNVIFHRVVPNFVIQTGDPSGTGWSGTAHTIVSEFSAQPFDTYYVGMASSGKDTEGSQWFVMQNHYPHLDGNYTNFGKVINGFEVINLIDQYDNVKDIELIK